MEIITATSADASDGHGNSGVGSITAPGNPSAANPVVQAGGTGGYCYNPNNAFAGVRFGVIPAQDLVVPPSGFNVFAPKFYAITKGHFIGVFDNA